VDDATVGRIVTEDLPVLAGHIAALRRDLGDAP
jgi:hypothetical protein